MDVTDEILDSQEDIGDVVRDFNQNNEISGQGVGGNDERSIIPPVVFEIEESDDESTEEEEKDAEDDVKHLYLPTRFNEKLQHPSHSIPIDSRSLSENVAALALSEEIYHEDQVKDELAEERRERYEKEIIRLGQEKLVKGMSCGGPVWSKPPEMRGKRGRDIAEKLAVEESWE